MVNARLPLFATVIVTGANLSGGSAENTDAKPFVQALGKLFFSESFASCRKFAA